ncbi:MAG: hypothetical protein U0559_02155 [Anaerolineae bacterium]
MDTDSQARSSVLSRELALSFRREIVAPLFTSMYHGYDANQIIGIRGVGLSNLLRFICERRAIAYHLGEMATTTLLPVYLGADPRYDTLDTTLVLCRVIADSVYLQLRALQWSIADRRLAQNYATQLAACKNDIEAEVMLSDMLGGVGHAGQSRIALIFDDFDQLLVTLPTATLRALRRLRDNHKHSLTYVTGTRSSLVALAARQGASEPLSEKFTEIFRVQFWVPPYSERDARALVERRTVDGRVHLDDDQQADLYRVTGGHAKLLVAALACLNQRDLPWSSVSCILHDEPTLHNLCYDMWNDLESSEQATLVALVYNRHEDVNYADLLQLRHKGLVRGRPDGVFATVFEEFIRQCGAT